MITPECNLVNIKRVESVTPHTYHISDYIYKINNGEIDLDFKLIQRPYVWDYFRQQKLIESILMGVPIPPLIFVIDVDKGSGRKVMRILDGQQRLKTIYNFVVGKTFYEYEDENHPGKKFKLWFNNEKISEEFRKDSTSLNQYKRNIINDFDIASVEYKNLNEKEQAEMFVRIQLGLALNKDHIIHALLHVMNEEVRKCIINIKDICYDSTDIFRYENYSKNNRAPKFNKETKESNETYFYFISYAIFRELFKMSKKNKQNKNYSKKIIHYDQVKDDKIVRNEEFQNFVIDNFDNISNKFQKFIKFCRKNHFIVVSENFVVIEFYYYYNKIERDYDFLIQILPQTSTTVEKWEQELKNLESKKNKYRAKVKEIYKIITNDDRNSSDISIKLMEFKIGAEDNLTEKTKLIIDFLTMMG